MFFPVPQCLFNCQSSLLIVWLKMWKFKSFCLDYWHVLCLHPHNNFYKRYVKKANLILFCFLSFVCILFCMCHRSHWHINVFSNRLNQLDEAAARGTHSLRVNTDYRWYFVGLLCCYSREVEQTVRSFDCKPPVFLQRPTVMSRAWNKGILGSGSLDDFSVLWKYFTFLFFWNSFISINKM